MAKGSGSHKSRPTHRDGGFKPIKSDFSQMVDIRKVETDVAIKNRELFKKK